MPKTKEKIVVLMSGGVDSSTTAALLVKAGHTVAGVYLKFWDPAQNSAAQNFQSGEPCWAVEMRDAARVAVQLGIPFQVWDVTAEYKKRVLENFYAEYAAGRTPNPDVLCNSEIKFGVALDRARAAGYEYVATGHYARVRPSTSSGNKGLYVAVDKNKDQSYFLWRLTQEQLAHTIFTIGEYTKPQVRAMAAKFGLHNADKRDSQGVCFLGKIELKKFLKPSVEEKPGPIVDVHGNLLGFQDGLAHFTIGQRHGTKLGGIGPYFVVEKDMASNTLIVANERDESEYRAVECRIKDEGLRIKVGNVQLKARTRYRAPLVSVTVQGDRVVFDEPVRAVAPGQSIVFYDGDRVIGGGIINSTTLLCKVPKYAHVS